MPPTPTPWITFETSPSGNIVTCHEPPPVSSPQEAQAGAIPNNSRPSFVTFVGRRSKAILLDKILGTELAVPVHKEVYLWSLPRQSGCAPLVVIDSGMQNSLSQHPNPTIRAAVPATSWSLPEIGNFNATLCGKVFFPFSSVICCFVSDIGGPRAVAKWLADLADAVAVRDLPTVPRILLVMETRSDTFDERIAANKATANLKRALRTDCSPENRQSLCNIREIEVLGLHSGKPTLVRARALKRRLLAISEASMIERASNCTQFSYGHFHVLTKQALDHMSTNINAAPFKFASASRPSGFTAELLEACLTDFLHQMPSQSWLWHFAAPLIASALLLASYPPNAHDFAPDYLFTALYSAPCKAAIITYTIFEDIQHKFVAAILDEFNSIFKAYQNSRLSASEIHRQTLRINHPHFADLKSHRTCFSCFLRMPEKVLVCGHALCDPCIRIFGARSPSEKNTFELTECILCGVNYKSSKFHFVPPTAGIRMLSVDGGGIRGVLPLVFLQHLDHILAPLGCAIKDHFDFVCGTSAGGLVVIGMFLLQWGATESIRRFEQVAQKTFGKRKDLISRALQLITAYVEDGKYSLAAIQEAFRKTFNSPLQMFNPLRNDTKVAVTTTAVHDALPWLFTNYNGGKRPDDVGYDVVRAEQAQNDITVSDAACCTSAAPWFFKPQTVRSLGIYQDGGLQHNNPASIAQWESRFLWPAKDHPDFALSLGTGTSTGPANLGFTNSRFYVRLFKSFMRNLDGEDAWKRFYNSLDPNIRTRYHRLNVKFTGPEPSLDDALQIPDLKAIARRKIEEDKHTITLVVDAILASMFYFELDAVPTVTDNSYFCFGHIYCRLDLPAEGLRYLYNQLVGTSSWFLIQGNPVVCVQSVPRGLPPFQRSVTFHTESMDDIVTLSIRGITSTVRLISGFPTTLKRLVNDQGLVKPFGTIDHAVSEKPLPAIPAKRPSSPQSPRPAYRSKRMRVKTGFF